MLKKIFSDDAYRKIITTAALKDIAEIRLKKEKSIQVFTIYGALIQTGAIAAASDIQRIIDAATGFSRYAYEDEIRSGYLVLEGGYRIGLAGVFVEKNGKAELKSCDSLVIRIPHEVFHASVPILKILTEGHNTLILSPPGGGKTTLLRDAARELSEKKKVLIVDERFEIGGMNGELNVGRSDIVSGVRKKRVLEGVIRAMSPETVMLDELFGEEEYALTSDLAASGITIVATLHANSLSEAKKRFSQLNDVFRYAVTLSSKPRVGSIQSIERL